ncbi:hypothetical protein MIND_01216700 [Mycena indigotica]|uniref:Uncharacterized protein n=1 Tax=Mycena indigotica TaxID=2126181 RepID=A0A8H6VS90_9AGAR|nr:uncharacterized protein MIND_01216700 [Mycena indigotica]KAF7291914.1 hypothetical protein MIND_01216700 [Mycena indigotica]
MSTVLPPDLVKIQEDYKPFIVFFTDLAEGLNKGHFADLTLPVRKVLMVTSGKSNGHWFLGLVQEEAGGAVTKCTYINCKASKLPAPTPTNVSQTWVGPLTFNDTWYKYELPVVAGHTARDFLNVLLAPTASEADGVGERLAMLYYEYDARANKALAGCRHWTESAARAFQRAGLMADSAANLQAKITEGGKIEIANLENPHGRFYNPAPVKDDQGPPYNV